MPEVLPTSKLWAALDVAHASIFTALQLVEGPSGAVAGGGVISARKQARASRHLNSPIEPYGAVNGDAPRAEREEAMQCDGAPRAGRARAIDIFLYISGGGTSLYVSS